ncbi:polysaccharide deacetylase family protein [Janthinobacterium fluminis]|uniref:NodB homology domain-containing protein n=1 Tax=Janthinobacterium fluminis TaxID=2987524 RepID=A0ABT5K7H0_9BURK|nr:hypothetical protein [Janthinobacterium fluminis]MDC8760849.1 hypothetical protein [Janthinobacterium fluminis]
MGKKFSVLLLFLLSSCKSSESPRLPTIAITFDVYSTTYTTAFPIMKEYGLVGTYFNDPNYIDDRKLADYATVDQLKVLQSAGWSIQGYSSVNMVKLLSSQGEDAAIAKLHQVKNGMMNLGFSIQSLAPASRDWNSQLRTLSQGIYRNVRANKNVGTLQSYPIPDRLNVRDGATASLGGNDTEDSLNKQLNYLEQSGGMLTVVIHKVGDDKDPLFSVKTEVFRALCERIAKDVKEKKLRAATFEDALANS